MQVCVMMSVYSVLLVGPGMVVQLSGQCVINWKFTFSWLLSAGHSLQTLPLNLPVDTACEFDPYGHSDAKRSNRKFYIYT